MPRGPFFVTLEGVEGCGKTTQARLLDERLRAEGYAAVLTYEPGGTPLGRQLRSLVLGDDIGAVVARAELLLFAAARAQLVCTVVEPALQRGGVVVCDRYVESSLAYQGYARSLPIEDIRTVNTVATGGLRSDLVVLLDLPARAGLERKSQTDWNRFEREEVEFHQRVRAGYLALAASEPERWLVLDATLPLDEIARRVWERVCAALEAGKAGSQEAGKSGSEEARGVGSPPHGEG